MTTPFSAPNSYVQNEDGFAPPTYGGAEATMYGTIAYTDTTAKNLFTLPEGAVVTGITINVTTEFDDTVGNTLDIGITGNGDYFADGVSVATAGQIVTGMVPDSLFAAPLTEDTQVTATYIEANSDATEGAATIAIRYILR